MSTFTRWLREPLLHFILLGLALFALHRWVAPPAPGRRIVLSESVIQGLRQDHLRRTGTPPTAAEEAALIARFIDNEVLYREALALGLDRGDIIVRRRLVQKMEFLTEDLDPIPAPTDAALQAYLDTHSERYAVATRVAATHVFVSTDRHGADVENVAAQLRERLVTGTDPTASGDPFLRGNSFPLSTERELAAIFGASFAAQVMSEPVGSWSASIRSSYGLHLVRVSERAVGHVPQLAEVGATVQRDWQEDQRAAANRTALARLRQHYDVRIEGVAPAEVAVAP